MDEGTSPDSNWDQKDIALSMLGGAFKHFLFLLLFEEVVQFDEYCSDGLKPPTSMGFNVGKRISRKILAQTANALKTCR